MPPQRKKNRKFTDQQFLELYNRSLNDQQIADILNVSRKTVHVRRWQLNLLPQRIMPNSNPKYNLKNMYETAKPYQQIWKEKNPEKYKQMQREKRKEYVIEKPNKIKEIDQRYRDKPETKRIRKLYNQEYFKKNREKINQQHKEYRHKKGISKTYRTNK